MTEMSPFMFQGEGGYIRRNYAARQECKLLSPYKVKNVNSEIQGGFYPIATRKATELSECE